MGGAFQALANSRAAREGQTAESTPSESRDSGHPVWGAVVRARAAAAKADREARSQEREAEAIARTSRSDLAELQKGLTDAHETEVANKPELRGIHIHRELPGRFKEQIARLPADHPLRTSDKPYFDVMSGSWKSTWKADMKAPAPAAKSEGGHFKAAAMFQNTARRQRERERR